MYVGRIIIIEINIKNFILDFKNFEHQTLLKNNMIRNFLPYFIYKRLFGDRLKYKTKIKTNDRDWKLWLTHIEKIYSHREESLWGKILNYFAYNIMQTIRLKNKTILEIDQAI